MNRYFLSSKMGAKTENSNTICSSGDNLEHLQLLVKCFKKEDTEMQDILIKLSNTLNCEGRDLLYEEKRAGYFRNSEHFLLNQQLRELKESIHYFCHLQQEVKSKEENKAITDVRQAAKKMIKSDIMTLKDREEAIIYQLARDEYNMSQELKAMFGCSSDTTATKNKRPTFGTVHFNMPFEVIEFEEFIQKSGGHLGGWSTKNHQIFLKLRNKYKNISEFLSKVTCYLPGMKELEIKEHELWYQEYIRRKERKDNAIFKWKKERQEKKLREEEMRIFKREMSKLNELPNIKRKEKKHQENLIKVKKWKENCKILNENKKQEEIEKQLLEAKRKEKQTLQRIAAKEKVQAYLKQKKEKEILQNQQAHDVQKQLMKTIDASHMIRIFQLRDELHFIEKQEQKMIKELNKLEGEIKLQALKRTVSVDIPVDRKRVQMPTKSWTERMQNIGPVDMQRLLYLPRRAIPTWRKDIYL